MTQKPNDWPQHNPDCPCRQQSTAPERIPPFPASCAHEAGSVPPERSESTGGPTIAQLRIELALEDVARLEAELESQRRVSRLLVESRDAKVERIKALEVDREWLSKDCIKLDNAVTQLAALARCNCVPNLGPTGAHFAGCPVERAAEIVKALKE